MPKRDEMVELLAELLAGLLTGDTRNIVAAFFLYKDEMGALIKLQLRAQRAMKDPKAPKLDPEDVVNTIERVWRESKHLTVQMMDIIEAGMDAHTKQLAAEEASSTKEWINCY